MEPWPARGGNDIHAEFDGPIPEVISEEATLEESAMLEEATLEEPATCAVPILKVMLEEAILE